MEIIQSFLRPFPAAFLYEDYDSLSLVHLEYEEWSETSDESALDAMQSSRKNYPWLSTQQKEEVLKLPIMDWISSLILPL
jgi:hypothetical protein